MARILYYLVLKPLSLIPLPILYLFSDFIFFLLYHVVKYRQKVVRTNIRNSFPKKSDKEIEKHVKGFYKHLCDLMVESIRLFSMPKAELKKRFKLTNPELLDSYHDKGKSVILTAGHYNNWEWAAAAFNGQAKMKTLALYTPLSNKFFEKKFAESRGKNGLVLVPKGDAKQEIARHSEMKEPFMLVFGADQSPTYSKKVYWTKFLSQDTAVMFGSEKYAKELDAPVVFGSIKKVKRGYYEMSFETIEENPLEAPHCAISELHTRKLELQIIEDPQYWLWSHKRWKRKVTKDYPDGVIPAPEEQI